ncbi:MAG: DNA repair protein RecN [Propionibacteriaceae bacterium]|jgi:DNA repair protein RecN (Recombination protein N)|nr:DNA repair protein RecN [Propionibacteriaceae bacterium]
MLTELTISSLGVIERTTLTPGPGLTVVTGETGAGKTMVVTGLGLIAGARAESGLVRRGASAATVEARFEDPPAIVVDKVDAAGGQCEDGDDLIIVRRLSAGRSRSWVAGTSVPQGVAAAIGAELVTIHGQAEQIRLSTPERQRDVLDRAAGPKQAEAIQRYRHVWAERQAAVAERDDLIARDQERAREADMLRFGLEEIERVAPQAGEDAALVEEARLLQDADDLRAWAGQAAIALTGDDSADEVGSALSALATARERLRSAAQHDTRAESLAAQADEITVLTSDLAGQVSSYLAGLEADPARLDDVEQRLAAITTLTRKYGRDAGEVLAWADDARGRLGGIEGSEHRIAALTETIERADADLEELAGRMTRLRTTAAAEFAEAIGAELTALAMPHARVEFALTPLPALGPWGAEQVSLLFTANPGAAPAPLGKVASGGELSRVRLAIEVVLADSEPAATFVFDEVDAGVGGAVGLEIGRRLARLSRRCQVIVVTHLAQVAAFAGRHFVVAKAADGAVTVSGLTEVRGEARLRELARMMGGLDMTTSSMEHAQELLDEAADET